MDELSLGELSGHGQQQKGCDVITPDPDLDLLLADFVQDASIDTLYVYIYVLKYISIEAVAIDTSILIHYI